MKLSLDSFLSTYYSEFIKQTLISLARFGGIGALLFALNYLLKGGLFNSIESYYNKQDEEDRSCSTHIIGTQGSGKTYLAMTMFSWDLKKGYGALWLSTQGIKNSDLLNYIPKNRVNDVILLRPYASRSRGINLLRLYTNTKLEMSLVTDSVVVLFKRLFDYFGDNMEGVLTAATLAVLEYSVNSGVKVSLWDLYKFLSDDNFRGEVIDYVDNQIAIDMINEIYEDAKLESSLNALLRRMRKLLYHDQMFAFLSDKENDIDLLKAVNSNKIIICDFLAGGVGSEGIGKENSSFLSELVVSKFQLIAETRNIKSKLYPLYLDEFQTYTSSSDNITDFIDLNRQRRMPVILINQRREQLPKSLQDAVNACGTKFILRLNDNDKKEYKKSYPEFEKYIDNMQKRECLCDIRIKGKNVQFFSKTPDIPAKTNLGHIIEKNNIGKYTTEEIINRIISSFSANNLNDNNNSSNSKYIIKGKRNKKIIDPNLFQ